MKNKSDITRFNEYKTLNKAYAIVNNAKSIYYQAIQENIAILCNDEEDKHRLRKLVNSLL